MEQTHFLGEFWITPKPEPEPRKESRMRFYAILTAIPVRDTPNRERF